VSFLVWRFVGEWRLKMVQKDDVKQEKKKGFIARLMEKLDKKLEEKSKSAGCCSSSKDKGSSCC